MYQYWDHLGNVRVSFGRNNVGVLEITDANDYYPFGMNHLKTGNAFFGVGSYKNHKYNGKELQETGMYDYGARMYMADLGRWGVIDAYSEKYTNNSGYNYAINNPISFIDPDGNKIMIYYGSKNQYSEEYTYKKDRDYSALPEFLINTYKSLDALYTASDIEIDGKKVNVVESLISNSKELAIFDDHKENSFTKFKSGRDINGKYNDKFIGSINFKSNLGALFDDVKDLNYDDIQKKYERNDLRGLKVSPPISLLGHELGHGYNFADNPFAQQNRQADLSTQKGSPYFMNAEEKKTTDISKKIDMNLKNNGIKLDFRNNHRAFPVITKSVLSNEIKK
ncbi:RHS repeat domain-containing protein [Chryseobacterium sp. M5A1_1a]